MMNIGFHISFEGGKFQEVDKLVCVHFIVRSSAGTCVSRKVKLVKIGLLAN